MTSFNVNPELEKDAYYLADMNLSKVYLKDDKENPWIVLIPKKANAIEIYDLNHEDQCLLMEEVTLVAEFLKDYFNPTKINIGSLGNIVPQFHFHIIARYLYDRTWPGPLWGVRPTIFYSKSDVDKIKINFKQFFD